MLINRRAALATALPLLSRADAQVTPSIVRFDAEMEPLVRLMEDTPREKCAAMVVAQLRAGVPYNHLMAALFLAGTRNVNPRPPGFALHCLFVMHSAHELSLMAPGNLRSLPFFYALDLFKLSCERDVKQGDYVMAPLTGKLPAADRAPAEFAAAMDSWDIERAERAAAVIARTRVGAEAFEPFWRYGARDYRNIGHKAIFVANACRTLRVIGWRHAETVLRSLAVGLLDYGRDKRLDGFGLDDQTFTPNTRLAAPNWDHGDADPAATRAVLAAIRSASPVEACSDVAARLAKRITAASVWDAVHLAAAELTLRTAGGGPVITGIHAVSAANALHYGWQQSATPSGRALMLLQAVGWMAQFRVTAEPQKGTRAADITGPDFAREREPLTSVEARRRFIQDRLRHNIPKANEVHYYKFPVALIENMDQVSAQWRPHLAAVMPLYSKGPSDPETEAITRARATL